jgi:DNA-binding MarR family transcriptional regulator
VSRPSEFRDGDVAALRLVVLRLARRLRKHSGAQMSPSQLSALTVLERHGPLRLGDLVRREQIGKSTGTRLVANLEAKGLVQRVGDETDGRITYVDLTPLGSKHLAEATKRATSYLRRQLDALGPADQSTLLAALPVLERMLVTKP